MFALQNECVVSVVCLCKACVVEFLCNELCVFEVCALWIMCEFRGQSGVRLCDACALWRVCVC